ncbi:MAG TPA: hypothetical protein VF006_20550 [Longimicrobium sp.]
MSPGDYIDFGKLLILGLTILIPVTGFTARFALRPIAEALVRLRSAGDSQHGLEQRLTRIESEVDRLVELRVSVERLTEELEFNRKLALPNADNGLAARRGDA